MRALLSRSSADAEASPRSVAPQLQRSCACGDCESCRKKKPEVQRRLSAAPDGRSAASVAEAGVAPREVHGVLRSPGSPLDGRTRAAMEKSLGHDFSRVRVHAGPRAAASAAAVGAEAYTVGRHVVFGAGRYAPGSDAGLRLLAHELTHTLQQGQAASWPSTLGINRPGGADEREAERFSLGARKGGSPRQPLAALGPAVQRKVKAKVRESKKPTSSACLVHLHGDEQNALKVAATLHKERCANFVFLEHEGRPQREVPVENTVNTKTYTCTVDPNRIFADSTVEAFSKSCAKGAPAADKAAVEAAFKADVQGLRTDLAKAISRGRGGTGSADFGGSAPVVAFHNNTAGDESPSKANRFGGTSVSKYERISAALAAAKTPAEKQKLLDEFSFQGSTSTLKRDPKNPLTDPNNIVFSTDKTKDKALTSDLNVVFQDPGLKGTSADDGSLSVALESERYFNVEAMERTAASHLATNLEMGNKVLDHLGIPKEPCAKPKTSSSGLSGHLEAILAFVELYEREEKRVAAQKATLPTAAARDTALPAGTKKMVDAGSCRTYADKKELDARKSDLAKASGLIGSMKDDDLVRWILGIDAPPAWVEGEVKAQAACLEASLRSAPGVSSPAGSLLHSHVRPLGTPGKKVAGTQSKIWAEKFDFSRSGSWDRITGLARQRCSALIREDDKKWSGTDQLRYCFEKLLTDDEKQMQILQATAAPGVSRHHWGTDFDFPNVNPEDWVAGKTGQAGWADEHSWLRRNASTYGFVQPYTADSSFLKLGYIEERWHWSYYPIAQALQEWAAKNTSKIDAALTSEVWSKAPASFSFIRRNWQEFFFNVNTEPQF